MRRFTELFLQLDQTTKTNSKLEALENYFRNVTPEESVWGLYFLCGHKLKRLVKTTLLRRWAAEIASIPTWLFDECYEAVGDLAETIALVVDQPTRSDESRDVNNAANSEAANLVESIADNNLGQWVTKVVQPLSGQSELAQRSVVIAAWQRLSSNERLVFNKLLTGSFRVGVSQTLVSRGLAAALSIDQETMAHRLMGDWQPSLAFYEQLANPNSSDALISQPYPFFLANALEEAVDALGSTAQWQAEWKWDGIRAQVIRRSGETFIWSRGEELLSDRFPELLPAFAKLPDGIVLDGEVVAYREHRVMPFAQLQRRIGLKKVSRKILQDVPVAFFAFDILEHQGHDIRDRPLADRGVLLRQVCQAISGQTAPEADEFRLSNEGLTVEPNNVFVPEPLNFDNWETLGKLRASCRQHAAEGVMLKRLESPYRTGRPRGDWWKWKIEPYSIDAVIIYAERGHGRRAGLYSDYTFAVWKNDELVPFAKAYSGLTDDEIKQVDAFVRQNTLEKYGPMVKVEPMLVFELGFENIQISKRHKSGFAVRFPRILAWRHDKQPQDADSIETIQRMLAGKEANERGEIG